MTGQGQHRFFDCNQQAQKDRQAPAVGSLPVFGLLEKECRQHDHRQDNPAHPAQVGGSTERKARPRRQLAFIGKKMHGQVPFLRSLF